MNIELIQELKGLAGVLKRLDNEYGILRVSYDGQVHVYKFKDFLEITGGQGQVQFLSKDEIYPYKITFDADGLEIMALMSESDFQEYKAWWKGEGNEILYR